MTSEHDTPKVKIRRLRPVYRLYNSSAGHETTHRNMEIGRDQSETKETVSQVVGVEHSVIWI